MTEAYAQQGHHKHPYHLVDPSPWPIVGALAAFSMFVGLLMLMHFDQWWLFIVGLVAVLVVMFFWFRDVVREATFESHHTPVVQIGLRYGMALFIVSEVMFFAAFFWAFFDASLFPAPATGGTWPPEGVIVFNPWGLPFLNTLILLTSSCTVTWAHHAMLKDDRAGLLQGLALTVALGITFLFVQAYEYSHAPFSFTDGIYPSTFFMATGFHGFHVFIGTVFLIVCLYRAYREHFKPDHHFGLEAAAWYWHFVDVVWLFLFTCIYWWGGTGAPTV